MDAVHQPDTLPLMLPRLMNMGVGLGTGATVTKPRRIEPFRWLVISRSVKLILGGPEMDKPFANYPQQAGVDEAKTGMGSTSEPAPGDMAPAGTPGTGEAICPQCRGTGRIDQRKCENCNGTGKVLQGIGGA